MFCIARCCAAALLGSSVVLAALVSSASAKRFTVLHHFSGAPNDGNAPFGDLAFDAGGNLYGTTEFGGANDAGTIFKIAKDGNYTVVHSFDGAAGGSGPGGTTIDESTGDLYGAWRR